MSENSTPRTQETARTVTLRRDFDAPPERLFDAWTDVEMLTQWFGCATDMLWTVHTWDVIPGGAIHVSLDFDGTPYEVTGQFVEVDRPNRLHYLWENGQTVTVTIEAVGAGSRMRLEHRGLANEEMEQIVTGGWTEAMEQLRIAVSNTEGAQQLATSKEAE